MLRWIARTLGSSHSHLDAESRRSRATIARPRRSDARGPTALALPWLASAACVAVNLASPNADGLGGGAALLAQEAVEQAAVRDYNATAAMQNSGLYARAAVKWTEFLAKYPQDKRVGAARYYLGVCQLHAKQYPEAAANFADVLAKHADFAQRDGAQYNLAMAFFQQASASGKADDHKKAAAEFAKVFAQFPQSQYAAKAVYFQGESHYAAGELPQAVEAYQNLLARFAAHALAPDAYYALGVALQDLKRDAEAAAVLDTFLKNPALAQHPYTPEIRLRLGMSLFTLKRFPEAETQFATAAKVEGFAHADFALLRQAQCRLEQAKAGEATPLLDEFLKKFPQSSYVLVARLALGKSLHSAGQHDRAREHLQAVAQANAPEAAEGAYWLGRSLLATSKPQEALPLLEAAAAKFTQGEFAPHLRFARVDALYAIPERRKEAGPLYAQFGRDFPEHGLAPQAVYMASLVALGEQNLAEAKTQADAFLAQAKWAKHELAPAVLYLAGESRLLAAQQSVQADEFARAEVFFRRLTQEHPQHERAARARVRVGWCLYQTQKHDEAIAHLAAELPRLADAELRAEAQLLIGRGQAAKSQPAAAIAAFQAALQAQPNGPRTDEVLLLLAREQRAGGDAAAAVASLTRLKTELAQSPHRPAAMLTLAEIQQQQQKHDEAAKQYQEFVAAYPQHEFAAQAALGLASSQFALQAYPQAGATLDALLAKLANPQGPAVELAAKARFLRGLARQRQNQFQPALEDFQAYLTALPKGEAAADARFASALCEVGLKRFEPAVTLLAALAAEQPPYGALDKVYYELGHAHKELKREAESAAAFQKLVDERKNSPLAAEAYFHLGRAREAQAASAADAAAKQAALAQAEQAFAAGVALPAPPDLREKLRFKQAETLFAQGRFDGAGERFQTLLTDYPQGALAGAARFLAGESLFRQDKFTEALPLLRQVAATAGDKHQAQALYRAGAAAARQSQWSESQQFFAALLKDFPEFEARHEARYGLGWALQNQRNLAGAREAYKLTYEQAGNDEAAAKARFMTGEIAFEEKKHEEAIEHFLYVAEGYPYAEWQAFSRLEAGRCLVELGRKAEAIKTLQTLVDKFPDHPKTKIAQELLANLKK